MLCEADGKSNSIDTGKVSCEIDFFFFDTLSYHYTHNPTKN